MACCALSHRAAFVVVVGGKFPTLLVLRMEMSGHAVVIGTCPVHEVAEHYGKGKTQHQTAENKEYVFAFTGHHFRFYTNQANLARIFNKGKKHIFLAVCEVF